MFLLRRPEENQIRTLFRKDASIHITIRLTFNKISGREVFFFVVQSWSFPTGLRHTDLMDIQLFVLSVTFPLILFRSIEALIVSSEGDTARRLDRVLCPDSITGSAALRRFPRQLNV